MTTILITGASSGIGRAAAQALAAPDVTLILTGRRKAELEKTAAECRPSKNVRTLVFDIRDQQATLATLDGLAVDVLVNNAGLALDLSSADSASLDDWNTMIDTNIRGLVTATRTLLPGMKARGRGHIVNVSSIAGTYPYAGANVYGASKAFVTYFSLALRADLLGSPIRVTNLEPGMAETEFSTVRFKGDKERADAVYQGLQPLTAKDIAEAIRWAVSQPPHVNINRIEMMALMQAPGGPQVARKS
ncbi:MAG: SDR family NAD(P)-dependent oxidoreductase [Rickettsiales bacterium]|nr:SDR family NAD(P)-dependent oxidoreductase [Rickettsiales bacterium]